MQVRAAEPSRSIYIYARAVLVRRRRRVISVRRKVFFFGHCLVVAGNEYMFARLHIFNNPRIY